MSTQETITALVERSRAALAIFETCTQEQADAVTKAVGKHFCENAERYSTMARNETGMGVLAAKIAKHQNVAMGHWATMKGKKSVGQIDYDPVNKIATFAKPLGVLACITPTTNPTTTICGNSMCAFKCLNTVIVAPHPNAKNVTKVCVDEVRAVIKSLGLPEDILLCIEDPTIEATNLLLPQCDAVIATGGPGMVKAAYSCGRPSFGVGQGNVQSIIDRGCKDQYDFYTSFTINNRIYDNGVPCTSEQTTHFPVEDTEEILGLFQKNGAFIIDDDEKLDRLRKNLFVTFEGGHRINAKWVGKSAMELSEAFDLGAPEGTKILLCKARGTAKVEPLCCEKLCPIVAYLPYNDFEEAMDHAITNLKVEGAGHSCCLFTKDDAHITEAGERLPVSRVIINGSTAVASGCSPKIGLNATISLGCGSWGGNSISENLTYYHLMNTTKVATFMPDAQPYDAANFWA